MREHLTRSGDPWDDWLSPELVLSQTCGLPYRTRLHGRVTMVGAPVHDLPCKPGYYYSVIVARAADERSGFSDFSGATLAVNDALSQSGWAAPQTFAQDHGFRFEKTLLTGAHRASAKAVAAGNAEVAAVDAVTWGLIRRFDDFASDLKEITSTPPTPALPYITARGNDIDDLFNAMSSAIDQLESADRELLCLKGLTAIHPDRYIELQTPVYPA